jgi:hypothetical protein
LKWLGGFVFFGDFGTPANSTYFWSGNTTDSQGNIVKSAMDTAQFLARKTGGYTVEMTADGDALNIYKGSSAPGNAQSVLGTKYLKQRFKYLDSPALREHLLGKEALGNGMDVRDELGQIFFLHSENPLNDASKDTTDSLWNVVSIRFARQAVGEVKVIHARDRNDPFFKVQLT